MTVLFWYKHQGFDVRIIIEDDQRRWAAGLDIFEVIRSYKGRMALRPTPMAVATAIGKSVEEVFRPFGAWAFDAKHMSKAASYIRDDAWEMFILMAGFEKTAAKDFVSVLSTAQDPESLPTTPKPFLLTPEGMQKRIDELERDLKQTKRSLSGLHSELNSVTLELGGRLERLENSTPTTDAADAILAEANRLYAKGKAMKGSR